MTNPAAHVRVWRAAHVFVDSLKANSAFEAAAAIAFWFFLSLLPLLVLLGFLLSLVARSKGVDALITPLLDVVPGSAEDVIRKELDHMATSTSGVAPLGVAGFLWTASSGLHNLMDVLESTARVLRRPWWLQRSIAIGWVLLGLAGACLAAWVLVKADGALHAGDPGAGAAVPGASASAGAGAGASASAGAGGGAAPTASSRAADKGLHGGAVARGHGALKHRIHKALHTPAEELLATGVVLVLGMVLLAAFYRFSVEHPADVKRRVWPGTFTAVASWLLVSWGFGLYAVSMSSYALYYGSLAAVAVMMVWLYLTSLALVVGATVNARLEGVDPG